MSEIDTSNPSTETVEVSDVAQVSEVVAPSGAIEQTPALTVSVSAQDRTEELRNAIPAKRVVEGKIRYYTKGVSCIKFGLKHDYKPVPGKKWAKCHRCNSTRTIKDVAPETPAQTQTTEVSA